MASLYNLPIQNLKGVGEKRARLFERLGAPTVGALLRFYPRAYSDWSAPCTIDAAPFDEPCCVLAQVVSPVSEHRVRGGITLYKCTATDGRSDLRITLFNSQFAAKRLKEEEWFVFYGKIGGGFGRREMSAPVFEPASSGRRIHPVYPQTEGLSSKWIEAAVKQALILLPHPLPDPLPASLRSAYSLCPFEEALQSIHAPASQEALAAARRRLAFEELFILQLGLLGLKSRPREAAGLRLPSDQSEAFFALLPFAPTGAQRRAVSQAVTDMMGTRPMSRLLQGDVGSGKTAVAAALCYCAAKSGMQAAVMAPTEILAEQHFRTLCSLLQNAGVRCALLTGSLPAKQKKELYRALAAGEIDVITGTHALLSEGVAFSRLGLVVTDEQHRFGVNQRAVLAAKGDHPHLLVMSATPIPRTLALMLYGDLDISVLDELPPGRRPVATYAVGSGKRERAFHFVKRHLDAGRQGYLVCPLVEESESAEGLKAAGAYYRELAAGAFSGYRLGLLHGRMKGREKEAVMAAFATGELDLLVSTTVIEVGVDVPNATIMVVENAERFGLSQLHQLRGRVGRGKEESACVLISDAKNPEALRRLQVMTETNDGFRIADEDLKLRGPGDFFGARQHGLPGLRIADLSSDLATLQQAQQAARALLARDPHLALPEHRGIRAEVAALIRRVGAQGLN